MTTGIVIGALAAFVIHPPNWSKVWDRVNRLLSVGAKPQGRGDPLPSGAERHLHAAWEYDRQAAVQSVTAEFYALVRPAVPEEAT